MGTLEKEKVRLLAIQMESVIGERELNIDTVKNLLVAELEKYGGADFLFLPEVWTAGWEPSVFPNCVEEVENSQAIGMLRKIARQYSVNIIGGSIIRKEGENLYNSSPIINRNGELLGFYDKNHLFSYYGCAEGEYITRGDSPVMVNIEGVNIGITICYDIRFPEIYRVYRKAGADILVNMAAWGKAKKIPWDSMTTSRAVENQTYMVALTQTGLLANGDENLGHSMILDYQGNIMDEINEKEGGIYAEINLNKMYEFRDKCKVLDDIKDSYEVKII
jgi:predicted amidohydrolase